MKKFFNYLLFDFDYFLDEDGKKVDAKMKMKMKKLGKWLQSLNSPYQS